MSGILLTSAYASRIPTANPDPEFKQVLPAPPVALREFPRNDTLGLFVEVYDTQVKAAHRVAIKTTILDDSGKALVSNSDERRSEELQGGKGGYAVPHAAWSSRTCRRGATCCASRRRRCSPTAQRRPVSWSSGFGDRRRHHLQG